MQPRNELLEPLKNFARRIRWERSPNVKTEGIKTVGVHVPMAVREHLQRIQQVYGLKSYRDAVYLALRAGITALVLHEDSIMHALHEDNITRALREDDKAASHS